MYQTSIPSFQCIKTLNGHIEGIKTLFELQDNNKLLSIGEDHTILIWNLYTNESVQTIIDPCDSIIQLDNGNLLSANSITNELKLWDQHSFTCIDSILLDPNESIAYLTQLDNGTLVSCGKDKKIKIRDVDTFECLKTLEGHRGEVIYITRLRGGKFASYDNDNNMIIWDKTYSRLTSLSKANGYKKCVVQLKDERLVVANEEHNIEVLDFIKLESVGVLKGHLDLINAIILLKDNNRIVSCSNDKMIKVWSAKTMECVVTLEGHCSEVVCVYQLKDGRLASGAKKAKSLLNVDSLSSIKIWDI